MPDALWYVGAAGVGAAIGLATLPWSNKPSIGNESPISWLLIWACLWPFLTLFAAWEGWRAYRKAWRDYSDRRQAVKHRAQQSASDAFPDFLAHQTVKDTYFKRRQ